MGKAAHNSKNFILTISCHKQGTPHPLAYPVASCTSALSVTSSVVVTSLPTVTTELSPQVRPRRQDSQDLGSTNESAACDFNSTNERRESLGSCCLVSESLLSKAKRSLSPSLHPVLPESLLHHHHHHVVRYNSTAQLLSSIPYPTLLKIEKKNTFYHSLQHTHVKQR